MKPEITEFSNGVRLVTEAMPGTLSASIGIWAARGARHERPEENGIAHFLEHMAFKGTSTRSAREIAETIENVGGYLNAYTAKDMTAYYARVLGADVPLAFDVLSDILLDPSFAQSEVEVERGVILQEIGQTNDTPDDVIFDWLAEASYPDQALGRPILGSPKRVRAFQPDDFRDFVGQNYGGDNLVISAAGDVDHDALAKQLEAAFSGLTYQSRDFEVSAKFHAGQKRVEKDLEQAHIALSFAAPSLADERIYTAQVVNAILGGGMSSRLFQSIREERGLCYTIFSSLSALSDTGQLIIYSGTSEEGIDPLMEALSDELKTFAARLDDKELERAKAQFRAGSVMALETAPSRVERNARQLINYGEIHPVEEILQKVDAVSRDDIAALAQEVLQSAPQMVLYGRIQNARDFDGFMKGLK